MKNVTRDTVISRAVLEKIGFTKDGYNFHYKRYNIPYVKGVYPDKSPFSLYQSDDTLITELKDVGHLADLWFKIMAEPLIVG